MFTSSPMQTDNNCRIPYSNILSLNGDFRTHSKKKASVGSEKGTKTTTMQEYHKCIKEVFLGIRKIYDLAKKSQSHSESKQTQLYRNTSITSNSKS